MLGFVLTFVQGQWIPFEMKPLNGFTTVAEEPSLTLANFASGDFQNKAEDYIGDHFGFREFFIRLYNQFSYSCFRQINNDNIKEGRNHELYLKMYLDEITGKTLYSKYGNVEEAKAIAQQNVEETLRLIDTLHSHGTKFLFVFAPSKTWVYPENMPKAYRKQISDFSLEEYYIQLFKENGIPHIDFLSYFNAIKDTVSHPLYTQTGTHWAQSTIPFVTDSILRKTASLTNAHLPCIQYVDANITTDYALLDHELEDNLNLLLPLRKPALPNPIFTLSDTLTTDRPNLLVVGDSYSNQLVLSCFGKAFNHWDLWIYNRNIYSSRKRFNWRELKKEFDAVTVLQEADIVMAVFTAPMLYDYMFGFTRTAQELLEKGYFNEEEAWETVTQMIVSDSVWYDKVVEQAKRLDITTEECLDKNVRYFLDCQKNKIKKPK